MTILWGSEERNEYYNRFLGSGLGVELMPSKSILYDENPTLLQKQIERVVTGGKGYLGLGDSLKVVNRFSSVPKVTLMDVLGQGLVPLYLDGPISPPPFSTLNPCGEIPLEKSHKVILPWQFRRHTLLERVEGTQQGRWNPRGCFRDSDRNPNPNWLSYSH